MSTLHSLCTQNLDELHAQFLALVPKIETHAEIYFRHIRCQDAREDKKAECVALAWKWFLRLTQRGKDINDFAMVFVYLVARAVRSGRKAARMDKARDAMSERCQQRHGYRVESLHGSMPCSYDSVRSDPHGQDALDLFEERFRGNTFTPPPDAAAFRIDWPEFFSTLSQRDRELAEFLSVGNSATSAARRFNLSPGRVTQLRQQWCKLWHLFQNHHIDDHA